MSPENTDADTSQAEHPRLLTSSVAIGIVCFGVGLLVLAGGVLLCLLWFITMNPMSLFFGIPLALIGFGVNVLGLVLLYRGVTGPMQGAGNGDRNP